MTEVWSPISGYEGWYSVSSLGRIRRDAPYRNTFAGRILCQSMVRGYPQVKLSRDNTVVQKKIHSLVAEAFLGIRPDGAEVNHRDANKANNAAENLEYVTPKENREHAKALGLYPRLVGKGNGMYGRTSRGFGGRNHSAQAKAKISAAHRGNKHAAGRARSEDHLARLRAGHFAWREHL